MADTKEQKGEEEKGEGRTENGEGQKVKLGMTVAEQKALRDWLLEDARQLKMTMLNKAGEEIGTADYARLLGLDTNTMNQFWTKWDTIAGAKTWSALLHYRSSKQDEVIVNTPNVERVFDACNDALSMKLPLVIEGESGLGKSTALKKYRDYGLSAGAKVYYVDLSPAESRVGEHNIREERKRVLAEIAQTVCAQGYKDGNKPAIIATIKESLAAKQNVLLILDEVSSLKGDYMTILKDLMSALKDVSGLILAGTPYFMKTVKNGATRDKYLFKELDNRIFIHKVVLSKPTEAIARNIFKHNGVNAEYMDLFCGIYKKDGQEKKYGMWKWTNKPTYRGIMDLVKVYKRLIRKNMTVKVIGEII